MYKECSQSNVTNKWKTYVTGLMMRNFTSLRKMDKYFRMDISDSTTKAIEENWLRILGIDYEIISVNICKNNEPLGISLQGRNVFSTDGQEMMQRHFFRAVMPSFCIGSTNKFIAGDELLEINGLKVFGMNSKDVVRVMKKLPNYIQVVVARPIRSNIEDCSDYGSSQDIHSPILFYEMDDNLSSHTSTMRSNSSLFSSNSRDYGSAVSVEGLIDGRYDSVGEYLRSILGWRGPIVIEFKKRNKEVLGMALEEIRDPKTSQLIIVFKIILPDLKAAKDGRLHIGDRLLQVNGKSVTGVGFRKVCQWMKSAPGGRLILSICKPHFSAFNTENIDYLPDNCMYHTLSETDKLPKLEEENYYESMTLPPVPDSFENNLVINGSDDRLGVCLDIVDNGVNGCRIKRVMKGSIRDNGTLKDGDHITLINEVSLRIEEKNVLENCLRIIRQHKGDYHITFLKKEDIDSHKAKYSKTDLEKSPSFKEIPSITNMYANTISVVSSPKTEVSTKISTDSASFEISDVTIDNDQITDLGLVLLPCLNVPTKLPSISAINANSLADKTQLFKIDDLILSVNNKGFESMPPIEAERYLDILMQTVSRLHFTIKRSVNAEDGYGISDNKTMAIENKYPALSDLPDMYFCSLLKSPSGFGFSVLDLVTGNGVIINAITPDSPASKVGMMKSGQRIAFINNCHVSSTSEAIEMVQNTQNSIGLLIETPKFREFSIRIAKDSSNSLGLNIAGGNDTICPLAMIESIVSNTTCQYSEELQSEDIILEVNELPMIDRSHEEIITILRSLPHVSCFKIWRKVAFSKRDFLTAIDSPSSLSSQFSVTINKPVSSIPSFGISFNDILILDPVHCDIIQRYKTVISIERNSLCEKYAPEVILYHYLIAVNGVTVDVNISCVDLKEMIDSKDHVELLLSQDIPYSIHCHNNRYSPILMSHTEESSFFSSSSNRNSMINEPLPLSSSDMAVNSFEETLQTSIVNDRSSIFAVNETSVTNNEELSIIEEYAPSEQEVTKDFRIAIERIIVPKSDCIELGFRVFGGLNGGPNGETLPVYVAGVERNTCNWPSDRQEPWLNSGCQLLELNDCSLTSMDSTTINKLICSIEGDLSFKVVKFN